MVMVAADAHTADRLINRGGGRLLNLQQERRVLDLDKGIDVLQPGLHESDLGLDGVVSEGDGLAYDLLAACHEIRGEEFNELVLDVLDEVELCGAVPRHYEHCKEAVWLLDARVDHLHKDVRVLIEVNH